MKKYALKRVLQLIPILLVITFLSFAMMRLAGSDVVEQKMLNTGSEVSEEVIETARRELGMDCWSGYQDYPDRPSCFAS